MLGVDLGTLQVASGWAVVHLSKGMVLLGSSDDMRGAFCLFTLPECWRKFMTFSRPVSFRSLGIERDCMTYLALRVIPMGWASAVALFRHIHRRLGVISCLAEGRELRRDRPLPTKAGAAKQDWVQIFLDDSDAPRIRPATELVGFPHQST